MKTINTNQESINFVAENIPLIQYGINQFQTTAPMSLEQLCSAMSLLLDNHFKRESVLTSPEMTKNYLVSKLANYESEVFSCIHLDNQHQVLAYEELFYGTIDGASVYPREVVKSCLRHNSAAVIFAHNHPSGLSEPSQADLSITAKLKQSLALVDIRVLDHIIVGGSHTTSLAEKGLL